MISLLILTIICIALVFKFEGTVTVVAIIIPFLKLFNLPLLFPGGLFGLISIITLILFVARYGVKVLINNNYPLWIPTIVVCLSSLLSNIFGYEKHLPLTTINLIGDYIYPFLLWECLQKRSNPKFFINTLFTYLLILAAYALFELLLKSNPVIHYIVSNNLGTSAAFEVTGYRFGIKRLQSLLGYHVTLGLTCSIGFVLLLYIKKEFKTYLKSDNYLLYSLLFALLLCVFFTGTRSAIAGLAVGSISLVSLNNLFTKKSNLIIAVLSPLILALIVIPFYDYFNTIVQSFLNPNNVNGSNAEMRETQLSIALYYWAQSPIFGNGPAYIWNVVQIQDPEILGAESVWFPLLVESGLFGCLAFIYFLSYLGYKLVKLKMRPMIFLILLFLVTQTLSSVPGISPGYLVIFFVLLANCRYTQQRHIVVAKLFRYKHINKQSIRTAIH